uniref:Uncharacterized protein n=1 Tax=Strix occidentalis caurina TaxID=311401 RepID=A0A8D0FF77_STROC
MPPAPQGWGWRLGGCPAVPSCGCSMASMAPPEQVTCSPLSPSCSSNCELDYDLYRDDFPYRSCLVLTLLLRVPSSSRCSMACARLVAVPWTRPCSPGMPRGEDALAGQCVPPGSRQAVGQGGILTAPLPAVRAEELHSIKGELSQIKAQVDSLLESLDRMDQRRERLETVRGGPDPASGSLLS